MRVRQGLWLGLPKLVFRCSGFSQKKLNVSRSKDGWENPITRKPTAASSTNSRASSAELGYHSHLCAQAAKPNRVIESGRARGQSTLLLSTLLLSTIFSDLPIVSIESDRHSPDVQVAQERLRGRSNVSLRFGDAIRILPAEVRQGDAVLIDGLTAFRGLRLALRLLATRKLKLVFVHDCAFGSEERGFLDAHLRGALYSDSIEFARIARVLDARCSAEIPRIAASTASGRHAHTVTAWHAFRSTRRSPIECCSRAPWSRESSPVSSTESGIMGEALHYDAGV